jgi:hypothetical protein
MFAYYGCLDVDPTTSACKVVTLVQLDRGFRAIAYPNSPDSLNYVGNPEAAYRTGPW